MSVAALILTRNEERNLPDCLASVSWCEDVCVLDSGSEDGTVSLARRLGARVMERPFDTFAAQRNAGLESGALRGEWVLHLDADERVTPALRDEILRTTGAASRDAYRVASKLMFQGKWLKRAGMYPAYQVRLGRRDVLRFVQVGHGQREDLPGDRVGTLVEPLIHEGFSKGIADWIDRHNRYSSDEARESFASTQGVRALAAGLLSRDSVTRRRSLKALAWRLPCRPQLRFLYMAVLRGGLLDGGAGLQYCRMMAFYEFMTDLKTRELRARGNVRAR